jgi:hypothetical protein
LELGPFATTHTYELSGFSVPDHRQGTSSLNPIFIHLIMMYYPSMKMQHQPADELIPNGGFLLYNSIKITMKASEVRSASGRDADK